MKKYNFKIIAKDIIYKDVDRFTIKEFIEKLAKYDFCPICKKDWNKIRILKGRSSPLARNFKVPPDSIKGGWKINNVEPICTTCENKITQKAIKVSNEEYDLNRKQTRNVNIFMTAFSISLMSFGIYSWFNGFKNWGGNFGLWIILIALILFIISILQIRGSIMERHDGGEEGDGGG
mgnify:CR=1 FL=1